MSSQFYLSEGDKGNTKLPGDKALRDRPVVTDLLSDGTDRKITRNQKRRHDEINHVQKT